MKQEFEVQTTIWEKYFKMKTNFGLHLNNLVYSLRKIQPSFYFLKRANKGMKQEFEMQTKIVEKFFKVKINFGLHLNNLVFTKNLAVLFLYKMSEQMHET